MMAWYWWLLIAYVVPTVWSGGYEARGLDWQCSRLHAFLVGLFFGIFWPFAAFRILRFSCRRLWYRLWR